MKQLLIVVPVYGEEHLTHALVSDLEREEADYLIVDNQGGYRGPGRVASPGRNLQWAGGSQLGLTLAFDEGYTHAMTLNNDTRISRGFVDALLDPRLPADAGIVGPLIDAGFPSAEAAERLPAEDYIPCPCYREVAAVEGVAMLLTRECWYATGGIDAATFGVYGWGPDIDLALRARDAGFGIYTTEMAYINHLGQGTTNRVAPASWQHVAHAEMDAGMRLKHGPDWRQRFPSCSWTWSGCTHLAPHYVVRDLSEGGPACTPASRSSSSAQ